MTVTKPQHLAALERANEIRLARAQVKRDLKADPQLIFDLLDNPDPCLSTAPVEEILRCLPRFGPHRINQVVRPAGVNPYREIGMLTVRQREALACQLRQSRFMAVTA
jgi:hypothetical protein